ncbi:endonuclease [Burkholderia phage Milagro]|uniref:Endonuclease n=1 Tax=Burkholderia phage Milagro TaxID=2924901 RepID=A0AAE9G8J6_9CAUD|nr:endonuclease [Burkholderia phage Milagro]
MSAEAVLDSLTPAERSERMSRIKGRNTKPELIVRSLIHRLGYRYRLHGKGLPGRPDLVFSKRRKVIFVHGCFWHRHEGCRLARLPKSRLDFWRPKLEANAERDKEVERQLSALGWKVLTIWECEVKDEVVLTLRVRAFLDDTENNNEGS